MFLAVKYNRKYYFVGNLALTCPDEATIFSTKDAISPENYPVYKINGLKKGIVGFGCVGTWVDTMRYNSLLKELSFSDVVHASKVMNELAEPYYDLDDGILGVSCAFASGGTGYRINKNGLVSYLPDVSVISQNDTNQALAMAYIKYKESGLKFKDAIIRAFDEFSKDSGNQTFPIVITDSITGEHEYIWEG